MSYTQPYNDVSHRKVPKLSGRLLRTENHLALGERLQHEGRKVTIFTEEQQILLVEGIDDVLRIVFDNIGVGEDRDPVSRLALGRFDAVDRETAGQTRNTTKHGLERLGKMMGDIVLEDWAHVSIEWQPIDR